MSSQHWQSRAPCLPAHRREGGLAVADPHRTATGRLQREHAASVPLLLCLSASVSAGLPLRVCSLSFSFDSAHHHCWLPPFVLSSPLRTSSAPARAHARGDRRSREREAALFEELCCFSRACTATAVCSRAHVLPIVRALESRYPGQGKMTRSTTRLGKVKWGGGICWS